MSEPTNDDVVVRVSRFIPAAPAVIFDVLADPAQHAAIDGSGSVKGTHGDAPERLALGSRFGMDMRIGVPYRISNEVVEFEEGARIAWRHFGGHIWRYVLTPQGEGTLVTEEFDMTGARSRLALKLARAPQRNTASMIATLERLEAHVS